ncbi:MAG: ScyD/ScyE family protein [Bauldia sp.]
MRAVLFGLCGALALAAETAGAAPKPAPGWALEVVTKADAMFAGLARDGDDLLVTDLAAGRLWRRGRDGAFTTFGPTLPHGIDVIGDPTGPYAVQRHGGGYLVAQGWTPVEAVEGPYDHALLKIDATNGVRVVNRDFWNPYHFAVAGERIYVVDAARNSIERLAPDGARTTVATFGRLTQAESALKSLSPTEFSGTKAYEFDAVPTGIALDGERIYVCLFGGFPFLANAGSVVSLSEIDPVIQIDVSGLDAPVDVAVTAGGSTLFILEHGAFDQATGFVPGTGRLIAFDNLHGGRSIILDGLTRPAALLLWGDGEIVVSELGGRLYFLKPKSAK